LVNPNHIKRSRSLRGRRTQASSRLSRAFSYSIGLHALFAAGAVLVTEVDWSLPAGSSNPTREITVASLPRVRPLEVSREQEHETEVPAVLDLVEIVEEVAVFDPPKPLKPIERDPLLEEDLFEDLELEALETLEVEEAPMEEPLGEEPEPIRQLLESPAAVYPGRAVLRGLEGTVHLTLTVDPSGAVIAVELVKSSGHGSLDRAAIEAARGYRFEPGEGSITVSKPFTFQLS
jgi:TonB family protein